MRRNGISRREITKIVFAKNAYPLITVINLSYSLVNREKMDCFP